jgi:hypothetical protein
MITITDGQYDRLMKVLLNCVGASRLCPFCNKDFVPDNYSEKDAWAMYQELKEVGAYQLKSSQSPLGA